MSRSKVKGERPRLPHDARQFQKGIVVYAVCRLSQQANLAKPKTTPAPMAPPTPKAETVATICKAALAACSMIILPTGMNAT
jgi:hypothetical protein